MIQVIGQKHLLENIPIFLRMIMNFMFKQEILMVMKVNLFHSHLRFYHLGIEHMQHMLVILSY